MYAPARFRQQSRLLTDVFARHHFAVYQSLSLQETLAVSGVEQVGVLIVSGHPKTCGTAAPVARHPRSHPIVTAKLIRRRQPFRTILNVPDQLVGRLRNFIGSNDDWFSKIGNVK